MSAYNYESGESISITDKVLKTMKRAYDQLSPLDVCLELECDYRNEDAALNRSIDDFISANYGVNIEDICSIPRPKELEDHAKAWFEKMIRLKLRSALFEELFQQQFEEIDDLLAGRIVIASSFSRPFKLLNPSEDKEAQGDLNYVEAPYYSAQPARGSLLLGSEEPTYRVDLFRNDDVIILVK